jgi:hypothetical protein
MIRSYKIALSIVLGLASQLYGLDDIFFRPPLHGPENGIAAFYTVRDGDKLQKRGLDVALCGVLGDLNLKRVIRALNNAQGLDRLTAHRDVIIDWIKGAGREFGSSIANLILGPDVGNYEEVVQLLTRFVSRENDMVITVDTDKLDRSGKPTQLKVFAQRSKNQGLALQYWQRLSQLGMLFSHPSYKAGLSNTPSLNNGIPSTIDFLVRLHAVLNNKSMKDAVAISKAAQKEYGWSTDLYSAGQLIGDKMWDLVTLGACGDDKGNHAGLWRVVMLIGVGVWTICGLVYADLGAFGLLHDVYLFPIALGGTVLLASYLPIEVSTVVATTISAYFAMIIADKMGWIDLQTGITTGMSFGENLLSHAGWLALGNTPLVTPIKQAFGAGVDKLTKSKYFGV